MDLDLPEHLSDAQRHLLHDLAERNDATHGDDFLGLILSGSVARGMATERSDLDVYVVLTDEAANERSTTHSTEVDEVPVGIVDLETVWPFGTQDWYFRWSLAWSLTLLDRTGGRLPAAALRQATLSPEESDQVLIKHDRLDGYVNFAYRSLKSDRDGRLLERRLDAAEAMPWLLDVVFALNGRVRPYHKYLPWELHQQPLPDWSADVLLPLLERTLDDGDPGAVREIFARVEAACSGYDLARGHTRTVDQIASWGDELGVLRG